MVMTYFIRSKLDIFVNTIIFLIKVCTVVILSRKLFEFVPYLTIFNFNLKYIYAV